jgi:2-keto-3-deoxy-L-rhamnonate aldolase RhmA
VTSSAHENTAEGLVPARAYENLAKGRLAAGEIVLCMGLRQARTVDIVQIAAACGFDALYVDMEHSPISFETTSTLCAAAASQGITPLVRVPGHRGEDMSRVLDGGAFGVIVPHVSNRAEAQALVERCRFPPSGHRSVMGPGPALGYRSLPLGEINAHLNEHTLLIAMLETPQGIERADEIAAVPGIDVLLIGSNDLCTEMGIPGQLRHPRLREAYQAVAKACAAHGRVLGSGGIRGDAELQGDLVAMGARFIIAGSDVGYLMSAARKDVEALRRLPR